MKYIFFDIDGTLLTEKNGKEYIPESTLKTIQALQEKGHVTAIASGRSLEMILPIAKKCDIHHIVSDGGHGVVIRDELIHIEPLDKELVLRLCDELLEKRIPFAFMIDQSGGLYANPTMLNGDVGIKFDHFPLHIQEDFDYKKHEAYKVLMGLQRGKEDIITTVDAHKILRYVDECIAFEPDNKYKGVKTLVEMEKGNLEDIVFFGDGKNDIALFKEVPFSIAMGNAIDELKELAYFVTKNVDEDGIEFACKHFGFID